MGYLSCGISTINKIKVQARVLYSRAETSYRGEIRCVKSALYKMRTLFLRFRELIVIVP